jgi:hypothetical protein
LYRSGVDENDLQHKELLETEFKQIMETFKAKREVIQSHQAQMQELEIKFREEAAYEAEALQDSQILEAKCDAIKREVDDQIKRKTRAMQFVKKAAKQWRQSKGTTSMTSEEQDLIIRALKDVGTYTLKDLQKMGEKDGTFAENLYAQLEFVGLQPPSRSVSQVSSRASSVYDGMSLPASGRSSRAESPVDVNPPPQKTVSLPRIPSSKQVHSQAPPEAGKVPSSTSVTNLNGSSFSCRNGLHSTTNPID